MSTLQLTLFLAVVFGVIATSVVGRKRADATLKKLRAEARLQFDSYRVEAADPRFQFAGQCATVVLESESIQRDDAAITSYSLTRFARNQAGEYFMFISNPTARPFFKHVEHKIARIKLKDRYVPPATVG